MMNINEKVKWLQLNYPKICEDMNDCSHHYNEKYLNQYHLEGNIWSHTMMVAKLSEVFDYDDILQWSWNIV